MSPRNLALSAAALSASAVAVLASAALPALAQSRQDRLVSPAIDRQERRIVIRGRADEGMAEHLRAALQLRPDQDAALKAYVAAARPGEAQRSDMAMDRLETRSDRGVTTPERLAKLEERMSRQQAQTKTLIDATRRFYDQLDASQKRAFDAMPMLMVGVNIGPMLMPVADVPDLSELRELRELRRFRDLDGRPPAPPEPPRPPRPPL